MAFSPFLGRDGTFHRFTYIKLHIARIYDVPTLPDTHLGRGQHALRRHTAASTP